MDEHCSIHDRRGLERLAPTAGDGVAEYWIVDPKARSVTVYVLDDTGLEYAELGRYAGREQVASALLPSVEVVAGDLFPERTE